MGLTVKNRRNSTVVAREAVQNRSNSARVRQTGNKSRNSI